MKNLIILALTICSFGAYAHIEIGTYTGKNDAREACSFEVKGVTFKDNVRHPLNERVVIVVDGQTFELSHRPMIDSLSPVE